MNQVKRMNERTSTADELVRAARELFSRHGYDGTSVRAITALAGANLGAITYHFGSKGALYDAAFASLIGPLRALAVAVAGSEGPPLDRIEEIVRGLFDYLARHPEFPNLISHHLACSRPMPAPARETLQKNLQTISSVIEEGQFDGTVRPGNPRDMALSIVAQPMWLTLARRALREGAFVDQDDPETHEQIVESVVQFVRAGLRSYQEDRK